MALDPSRTPSPPVKGPRCSVCTALTVLDEHDRFTLQRWLDNTLLTAAQLTDWLRADGVDYVGPTAVSRHRANKCDKARRVTI